MMSQNENTKPCLDKRKSTAFIEQNVKGVIKIGNYRSSNCSCISISEQKFGCFPNFSRPPRHDDTRPSKISCPISRQLLDTNTITTSITSSRGRGLPLFTIFHHTHANDGTSPYVVKLLTTAPTTSRVPIASVVFLVSPSQLRRGHQLPANAASPAGRNAAFPRRSPRSAGGGSACQVSLAVRRCPCPLRSRSTASLLQTLH